MRVPGLTQLIAPVVAFVRRPTLAAIVRAEVEECPAMLIDLKLSQRLSLAAIIRAEIADLQHDIDAIVADGDDPALAIELAEDQAALGAALSLLLTRIPANLKEAAE